MSRHEPKNRLPLFLWPKFTDVDGSVFLASEVRRGPFAFGGYPDRTAAEAFVNHQHIFDILGWELKRGRRRPKSMYRQATQVSLGLAHLWAAKLAQEFPRRAFWVYATQQDEPIVRFHRQWPGEHPWASAEWLREQGDLAIAVGKVKA